MIFAIHPLNTQAVTYISSRSSIMATMFYLMAIILFSKGLYKTKEKEIKTNYAFVMSAVIFFGIGFLCKLIIISLPAILFAYHYYFISDQNIKIWVKRQWKLILGIADGVLKADGKPIYEVKNMKVGLFTFGK